MIFKMYKPDRQVLLIDLRGSRYSWCHDQVLWAVVDTNQEHNGLCPKAGHTSIPSKNNQGVLELVASR